MSSPIGSLAYALAAAISRDLRGESHPVCRYETKKGGGYEKVETGKYKETRPREDQCEVYHFPQVWSSTALGFGGVGGNAITSAYTTVVVGPFGDACVYFNGRFAYQVLNANAAFYEDLSAFNMASVADARKYQRED